MKRLWHRVVLLISALLLVSCNSSKAKDVFDVTADEPSRKEIDTSRLGINAFVNDSSFGSIGEQFLRVRDVYRLKRVRILFAWNDAVQPSPSAEPDFSFYDDIATGIPVGLDAFAVLTGVPSWMSSSANWVEGSPRTTFVEHWVKKVAKRYASNGRIIGWQIWNEPNKEGSPDNDLLGLTAIPDNYVEMLARAYSVIKDISSSKLVLNAATTAIAQNFPSTLNYNKGMLDAGVESFVDVYAIHVYGKLYENYVRDGGVSEVMKNVSKPIWVTESGKAGINKQLEYAERVWPFIREQIPQIDWIFIYQFAEDQPAEQTFGLENLTPGLTVSDLAVFLRDR